MVAGKMEFLSGCWISELSDDEEKKREGQTRGGSFPPLTFQPEAAPSHLDNRRITTSDGKPEQLYASQLARRISAHPDRCRTLHAHKATESDKKPRSHYRSLIGGIDYLPLFTGLDVFSPILN